MKVLKRSSTFAGNRRLLTKSSEGGIGSSKKRSDDDVILEQLIETVTNEQLKNDKRWSVSEEFHQDFGEEFQFYMCVSLCASL